jgi:hypothetical protein
MRRLSRSGHRSDAHEQYYLVPREQSKSREVNLAGESAYLTNEAEYGKLYPKDAVKAFKTGKKADQKGKVDEAI